MKKLISILLTVVMVLSLSSVSVFAEADWDRLEEFIDIRANSEYVEEAFSIGMGGISSYQDLDGYNLISDGEIITVTNNADSDYYKMYVGLEPFVKTEDGTYVSDACLVEGEESYVQYNFTVDGKLVEAGAINKFSDSEYYKILNKGESLSFTLPEKLSYNIYDRPYEFFNLEGKEVIWLVSVYTGYSETNNADELIESEKGLFWCYKEGGKSLVEKPINDTGFNDIKETDYYYDAVKWAVEKGITKGTSETEFSPNKTCTHAEILTFLWRAKGSEVSKRELSRYEDLIALGINENDYFVDAYKWAYDYNVIGGYTQYVNDDPAALETTIDTSHETPGKVVKNHIYNPSDACSRINTVDYLFNLLTVEDVRYTDEAARYMTDLDFNDKVAVAWAIEQGITKGTSETTFSPNDTCTRGQIVTFLYRAFANR